MKLNLKNVLFVVFVFVLFWKIPIDPDLGWHLRYGRQIFEKGRVFYDNQIGYFLSDHIWTLNYSLYQWLIFVLEKYVGLWSLSVVYSSLMVLMFWLIKRVFRLDLVTAVIVVLYFWLISIPVMGIGLRPQILSTVFLTLTYVILIKKWWWWLVPLSFIWANIHGAFILELVLMSVYFGELFIRKDEALVKFGLIALLTVGVSLINPFGIGIYEEALRHSWYPLDKLIAEWVPPVGVGIVMIFATISLVVMTTVDLVWTKKKNLFKQKNWLFFVSTWLMFLGLAFKARRNLSLFGIASIFLAFGMVKVKIREVWWSWLTLSILIVFLIIGSDLFNKKVNWSVVEEMRSYPMGAIEHLANDDNCHNIYNTYEWGGYLVWKLPEKKFFVDGRMPVWENPEKKSPYTIYLEIIQARPEWSERVIGYGTDCLLISKGTFLDLEIRDSQKDWQEKWSVLYEDDKSVLYQLRQ